MKKSKKFLSMLLAVSMIMAMSVTAFAAENTATALSDNAGQSIAVDVIHIMSNGEAEIHTINVDVPANATVAEENHLIAAMGDQVAGISNGCMPLATRDDTLYLCGSKDSPKKVNFSAMTPGEFSNDEVGSAYMSTGYDTLHMILERPSTGVTRIAFRFENSAYAHLAPDDNVFETYPVTSGAKKTYVIADGAQLPNNDDNAGSLHLDPNTTLTIYCSGMKSTSEGIKGSCYMTVWLEK